ncbi:LOW QUALITY PROTEIN: SMBP2-like protein [Mya arenaria]|uniref:SMBP2-like protein n=1 Tax=Mya arenaria TaxID=6604 RepID=A0ABY7DZ09_MYAAR|nr:LOW QUALITY PROTEIN: SMBP2-like protein [Mya arenaria]
MKTESPYQRAVQAESVEEGGSVDKDTRVEVNDVSENDVAQTKNKKRKNKIKNTDSAEKDIINDLAKENETKVPSIDVIEICTNSSKSSEKGRSDGNCSICQKDVIKANLMMHELHCAKRQIGAKSENYGKELTNRLQKVDNDDITALTATQQRMDFLCVFFQMWKTSLATLFQVCPHCEDVHGSWVAARAHTRACISKEIVLHRDSGVSAKIMDTNKKAHLQKQLNSKLAKLSPRRKRKPKKREFFLDLNND